MIGKPPSSSMRRGIRRRLQIASFPGPNASFGTRRGKMSGDWKMPTTHNRFSRSRCGLRLLRNMLGMTGEIFQRACARGDEHWAVWIDWYEAQLAGGGELSEKDEIARVSLPNEPERKVRSSPTPAFRDLSSRRLHAWRAAPHHAR